MVSDNFGNPSPPNPHWHIEILAPFTLGFRPLSSKYALPSCHFGSLPHGTWTPELADFGNYFAFWDIQLLFVRLFQNSEAPEIFLAIVLHLAISSVGVAHFSRILGHPKHILYCLQF